MIPVENLRPGDYETQVDLGRMAFGATVAFDPARPRIDEDRHSVVYEGDRVIASARTHPFAQWFGGRAVPCGGLSGVMIATHRRSEGLGRAVVIHALEQMRERGEFISSLFATTTSLYRSLGYEIAGGYAQQRVPIEALPGGADDLTWEMSTYDATEVRSVANRAGEHHDGWLVRPEIDWRWAEHQRRKDGVSADVYLGYRDGSAVAVVAVEYLPSESSMFSLQSPRTVGVDHDATGAALSFLARHGTTSTNADVTLPDHVLDAHLDQPQLVRTVSRQSWMTRIVDLAGAFAGRGWNRAVDARLDFELTDELIVANAGRWRVEIVDGKATAEPGGDGTLQLDIPSLSSWYTGHVTPASLAARGRLEGAETPDLGLMAAVGAGGTPPTVLEYF